MLTGHGAGLICNASRPAAVGDSIAGAVLISNMETIEQDMPVLYLWRGLAAGSGGPGRHRGGLSIGCAYTAHRAEPMVGNQGHAWDVPSGTGLFGGYMGASNRCILIEESDLADRLARGEVPRWESLAGTRKQSSELARTVRLSAGDVVVSLARYSCTPADAVLGGRARDQ